jgi:porphobilinogen synthase
MNIVIFQDKEGSAGTSQKNPTVAAIQAIKERFGDSILIACDVCLCPYTSDGHCGIVDEKTGLIENESSIDRIAAISLSFAKAGADIVAPSDMMDGRVVRIKQVLRKAKLENKVSTKPWKISKLYALFP